MLRHLYKQYVRIISKWPRDGFKHPDRDVVNFISKEVERQFSPASNNFDHALCERRLHALEELYNNRIVQQYPNSYKSGVFGLNLAQLQEASTEENRKHFGLVPKRSITSRVWGLFSSKKKD